MGINVLIVLRDDSLSHLIANRSDLATTDPRRYTYQLIMPDVPTVIGTHLDVMREAFTKWPKETLRKVYNDAIEKIKPYEETLKISTKRKLHSDLISLSRQRFRQIVEHYGNYVWLPVSIENSGDREIVTERFHDQYTPGIISFLQNSNRLFSQFLSEFPNIYLVVGHKRQERNKAWENLCQRHRHTYWLKRLILEYITQMQRDKKSIHPEMIYEVFIDHEGKGDAYEDSIVRLVLGSLAQVEKSNVINFKFLDGTSSFEIEDISLTNRGWRLLGFLEEGEVEAENIFFDTFTYLQIIVDDYILPIPNAIFKYFKYEKDYDYGYLAAPAEIYGDFTRNMIKKKIEQVYLLMDVLEISFEYEKIKFNKAFERLEENIKLRTFDQIRESVNRSIDPIERYIKKHHNAKFNWKDYMMPKNQYIAELREELKKVYCIT